MATCAPNSFRKRRDIARYRSDGNSARAVRASQRTFCVSLLGSVSTVQQRRSIGNYERLYDNEIRRNVVRTFPVLEINPILNLSPVYNSPLGYRKLIIGNWNDPREKNYPITLRRIYKKNHMKHYQMIDYLNETKQLLLRQFNY